MKTQDTKLPENLYDLLLKEFSSDLSQKQKADQVSEEKRLKKEALNVKDSDTDLISIDSQIKIQENIAVDTKDDTLLQKTKSNDEPEIKDLKVEKELKKEEEQDIEEKIEEKVTENLDAEIEEKPEKSEKSEKEKELEEKAKENLKDQDTDQSIKSGTIKLKKLGTITLPESKSKKRVASSSHLDTKKKKRKRILGDSKKACDISSQAPGAFRQLIIPTILEDSCSS